MLLPDDSRAKGDDARRFHFGKSEEDVERRQRERDQRQTKDALTFVGELGLGRGAERVENVDQQSVGRGFESERAGVFTSRLTMWKRKGRCEATSRELLKDNISRSRRRMAMSFQIDCCSKVGVGERQVFSINRQRRPMTLREKSKALELLKATAASARISAGNEPRSPRTDRLMKQSRTMSNRSLTCPTFDQIFAWIDG